MKHGHVNASNGSGKLFQGVLPNTPQKESCPMMSNNPMSIGIGQILVIVVVGVLLFGNFTGVSKDLAEGFNVFRSTLDKKETPPTVPSEKESSFPEESDAKKGS